MTDRSAICKRCKFWEDRGSEEQEVRIGECRKHAPTPISVLTDVTYEVTWPTSLSTGWCGEWKEK